MLKCLALKNQQMLKRLMGPKVSAAVLRSCGSWMLPESLHPEAVLSVYEGHIGVEGIRGRLSQVNPVHVWCLIAVPSINSIVLSFLQY